MSSKNWEEVDITRDELDSVAKALKQDEFKKLFFEYCEEVQNPENRKKYEEDIRQLEAERGVDVVFLNPEPGFVVKTSVDGKTKGFINIASCNKIEKPNAESKRDEVTGEAGVNWSIPYAQAPPRHDVDKRGATCLVYDVIFHSDALYLADKNNVFRKHLIITACDAVERAFKVSLDRTNLKFPKMKFKGVSRPTVVRRLQENHSPEDAEPNPLDSIYPPMPVITKNEKPPTYETSKTVVEEYAIPKYTIKHLRGVDLSELTYELDAKLNVTIPKELVVEIDLPMLNSTQDCNLDVTSKKLFLISERPAKYKLSIDLPYTVDEEAGSAKFDTSSRKLIVSLPVCHEQQIKLKDLYREDSGVEFDMKGDTSSGTISPTEDSPKRNLIEVLDSQDFIGNECAQEPLKEEQAAPKFLEDDIEFNFPSSFDCNTLDNSLALTLHVKNVNPASIACQTGDRFMHVKFASIGAGFYPVHYAFYVEFADAHETTIEHVETEVWDNNVIITLELRNYENLKLYKAGVHANDLKEYQLMEDFVVNNKRFSQLQSNNAEKLHVLVKRADETEVDIEISQKAEDLDGDDEDDGKATDGVHDSTDTDTPKTPIALPHSECGKDYKKGGGSGKKHQKKKSKKRRSLSESYCDSLKETMSDMSSNVSSKAKREFPVTDDDDEDDPRNNSESKDSSASSSPTRKIRSSSESRSDDGNSLPSSAGNNFKGILKRNSRYCRSFSESYSSIDDHIYSCSMDLHRFDSTGEIPEEGSQTNLSESCKKTVRFSDVIRKQLFRMDSSILGQRKKNQKKKNQKLRAMQRRNSEGDSVDYIDKAPKPASFTKKKPSQTSPQHDSGLDLSIDANCDDSLQEKGSGHTNNEKEKSKTVSDIEFKNPLIFDLEI